MLGSGVHVQIMWDCCIGTHMAMWFAASIPQAPISGIYPHVIPPQSPHPSRYPSLEPPQQTPVCAARLLVSMCSHCSTPTYD